MKAWLKLAAVATLVVAYAALGWIAGLVVLMVGTVLVLRHVLGARRALAPTMRCPWCRADVPQYGPYSCGSCHARTLGWAWRCSFCNAWAGHITCPACGMSVRNPLLPGP